MIKMVLSAGVGVDNKFVKLFGVNEIQQLLSRIGSLVTEFQDEAKAYLNEGTIYSCHIDVSVFNSFEEGDIF